MGWSLRSMFILSHLPRLEKSSNSNTLWLLVSPIWASVPLNGTEKHSIWLLLCSTESLSLWFVLCCVTPLKDLSCCQSLSLILMPWHLAFIFMFMNINRAPTLDSSFGQHYKWWRVHASSRRKDQARVIDKSMSDRWRGKVSFRSGHN